MNFGKFVCLLAAGLFHSAAEAATVAVKFSGASSTLSNLPDRTPYEIIVYWNPEIAPVRWGSGTTNQIYYYSYGDGSLRAPGLDVELFIGDEHFAFSSLNSNVGRTTVNLIDEPGDALDRFTLWVGDPERNWDFIELEFASISNDSLVSTSEEGDTISFDFSGNYVVNRVRFHPWGATQSLYEYGSDVTVSNVPEPGVGILVGLGLSFLVSCRATRGNDRK